MVDADADGGEPEADGRDRGRRSRLAPVADQAVGRIGLEPEVVEGRVLQRIEQRLGRERGCGLRVHGESDQEKKADRGRGTCSLELHVSCTAPLKTVQQR